MADGTETFHRHSEAAYRYRLCSTFAHSRSRGRTASHLRSSISEADGYPRSSERVGLVKLDSYAADSVCGVETR